MDDRSLSTERNSVISDSSSSSSNDTMKIRGSLPNMQSDEQGDSPSTPSFRSSVMLLGKLSTVTVCVKCGSCSSLAQLVKHPLANQVFEYSAFLLCCQNY